MEKFFWISILIVSGLVAVLWLGFLVPVRPFAVDASQADPPDRVPIPANVPAPVERYLRAVSLDGETLPAFGTAQYTGTGWAKPFGVWLPIRHRATVEPGQSMFRVMEFPWYGLTLLHVEDTYRNGAGKTAISGLIQAETTGPKTDQGAYIALAAESILLPSVQALEARWEGIDDRTARLLVPYRGQTEHLIVSFDPATGFPTRIQADRFKGEDGDGSGDEVAERVTWWIDLKDYRPMGDLRVPSRFDVSWVDEAGPWSTWTIEAVALKRAREPSE